MSQKSYLWNTRKELVKIGGLGDFGADYQPLEVSGDVAHQYDTPEAKAAGWVVTWTHEAPAAPVAISAIVAKPAVVVPIPLPVPAVVIKES